jgi:hypothetical protein
VNHVYLVSLVAKHQTYSLVDWLLVDRKKVIFNGITGATAVRLSKPLMLYDRVSNVIDGSQ